MDKLQSEIFKIVNSIIIDGEPENKGLHTSEPDTDLMAVGMDSIKFIRIIVALEEAYEIEIPDESLLITEMGTIGKNTEVVRAAMEEKNGRKQ